MNKTCRNLICLSKKIDLIKSNMSSMNFTKEKLFTFNVTKTDLPNNKVSIIGTGQVGMACGFSLLMKGVCSDLALSDKNEKKMLGEYLDLKQGLTFLKHINIAADRNLKVTANSDLIIITAGARQKPNESRLDLIEKNVQMFKEIVPTLAEHSPNAIFLIVTNPVDILCHVTWKLSRLPWYRIIGTGTNLDSARFRYFISEKVNTAITNCNGWIIGEHGDSSVPVWSSVSVGGASLNKFNDKLGDDKNDPENWSEIHTKVVSSAYELINLKGYTSWAIGLSVSSICESILNNEKRIYALSTLINKTELGKSCNVNCDVFISVPCAVGRQGVLSILNQPLSEHEKSLFQKSVEKVSQELEKIQI